MKPTGIAGTSALAALLALVAPSCESPVEDERIAAQGPELPNVEEGPEHRYGQDCMACHGGYGPGPEFVMAGTVFATPDGDVPVQGAVVVLTDAVGQTFRSTSARGEDNSGSTNCAGNFFIQARDFEPQYPVHVEVECPLPGGGTRRVVMGSRINREGGCGFCHTRGPASSTSPGQIYCLTADGQDIYTVPGGCEGGPSPSGSR